MAKTPTRVLSGKQLEAKMARIARAKAVKKPPTPIGPGLPVPYKTLVGMIGKYLNDSDVKATLATVGAVESKGFIIAREAGFSFMLRPAGAEDGTMVLGTLFLYADGSSKYRGFMDLPAPFLFGERAAVLAEATLTVPTGAWMQGGSGRGGKQGVHTEHLGHLLAQMQFLQRAYPGAQW